VSVFIRRPGRRIVLSRRLALSATAWFEPALLSLQEGTFISSSSTWRSLLSLVFARHRPVIAAGRMASSTPPSNFNEIAVRLSNGIEVSRNDKRVWSHAELKNGLRVMLIQDAESEMAGAALGVDIGSHGDPRDIPGLAHFLEHMLFLGTEK
jgi:hypothetical protein